MRKFLLLTILALFLCATGVYAAQNLKIIEDSLNMTGKTTQSPFSKTFIINNTGTENLNVTFTGFNLTNGTNYLAISSLGDITNLAPNDSNVITLSVIIPDQKQRPGLYTGNLIASHKLNSSVNDTLKVNVNVESTPSVSTNPAAISLGSASLNSTHTETFDITNTGNDDITNVSFAFSKSEFNLNSDNTSFTLYFNKTETIRFNITIPADYSTGNLTLGSVNIVSTELNQTLFSVTANIGGGLEIGDVDVFLATRKGESGSDLDAYDGRKLKFGDENAGPESELRFDFNIENTFSDKEGVDINDVTVRVTIEGMDDGADIEEESAEFDLDPTANEDTEVIIKIPLSVDTGVYDVLIEAQGEDDNGNAHTAQMSLKVDISKEARDIISKAELFPATIKCSGTSTLAAAIKNIGQKVEKQAKLEITNSDLGINFVRKNIELEDDPFGGNDEFTKSLLISIDKNTKAGTYPITVKSYLQEEILWETKIVNLVVEACDQIEEKKEAEPESIKEINKTEPVEAVKKAEGKKTESEEIPVLAPDTTTEVSFMQRPVFWILLIALNIIIIGAVAFLVVKVVKKQ